MGQPWTKDEATPGMWTPHPSGDRWKPSIRDDALWAKVSNYRAPAVRLAKLWRAAAEADGWTFQPTYGDSEPVERAWRGEREGFIIQGLSRPGGDKTMPEGSVHVWGPDRLAISAPVEYSGMDDLRRRSRICGYCGTQDVETERVGFAGRCCASCLSTVRPQIETPGWTE